MLPVATRDKEFQLEAWIFWERVRLLTARGLAVTGGLPCGEEGEIFDLLDAVCEAFQGRLERELGVAGF